MTTTFSYAQTRIGAVLIALAFVGSLFITTATPARAAETDVFPRAMAATYMALHTVQEKLTESAPLLQSSVSAQIAALLAQIEQLTAQLLQLQAQQNPPANTNPPATQVPASTQVGNSEVTVRMKTSDELVQSPRGSILITVGEDVPAVSSIWINGGGGRGWNNNTVSLNPTPPNLRGTYNPNSQLITSYIQTRPFYIYRQASIVATVPNADGSKTLHVEAPFALVPGKSYEVGVNSAGPLVKKSFTAQDVWRNTYTTYNGEIATATQRPAVEITAQKEQIVSGTGSSATTRDAYNVGVGFKNFREAGSTLPVEYWQLTINCPAGVTFVDESGVNHCNTKKQFYRDEFGNHFKGTGYLGSGDSDFLIHAVTKATSAGPNGAEIEFHLRALSSGAQLVNEATSRIGMSQSKPYVAPVVETPEERAERAATIAPQLSLLVNGSSDGGGSTFKFVNIKHGDTLTMEWDVYPKEGVTCTSRTDQDFDAGINGSRPGTSIPLQGRYVTPKLYYDTEFGITCEHVTGGSKNFRVSARASVLLPTTQPSGTATNRFQISKPDTVSRHTFPTLIGLGHFLAGVENRVAIMGFSSSNRLPAGSVLRYTHTGSGFTGTEALTEGRGAADTWTYTTRNNIIPADNMGWVTFEAVRPNGTVASPKYAAYVFPKPLRFDLLDEEFDDEQNTPAAPGGQTPAITEVAPGNPVANQNMTFTITGSNFVSGSVVYYVYGSGLSAAVVPSSVTSTSLSFNVTFPQTGSVAFYVTNPDGKVSNTVTRSVVAQNVIVQRPLISSITPTTVSSNTIITISGTGFREGATVSYNYPKGCGGCGNYSYTTTPLSITPTAITLRPTIVRSADVTFTVRVPLVAGGSPTSNAFTVPVTYSSTPTPSAPSTPTTPVGTTPTITSMSPASAVVGQEAVFTLNGSNFKSGAKVLYHNKTTGGYGPLTPTEITPTRITLKVTPGAAGTITYRVQNSDGETSNEGAPVEITAATAASQAPSLTSIVPNTAKIGSPVQFTLTGANFQQGAKIHYRNKNTNGSGELTPDSVASSGNSLVLTIIPGAAGVLDISVKNPDGTSTNTRELTLTAQ